MQAAKSRFQAQIDLRRQRLDREFRKNEGADIRECPESDNFDLLKIFEPRLRVMFWVAMAAFVVTVIVVAKW